VSWINKRGRHWIRKAIPLNWVRGLAVLSTANPKAEDGELDAVQTEQLRTILSWYVEPSSVVASDH
jgi:hypothetical protein